MADELTRKLAWLAELAGNLTDARAEVERLHDIGDALAEQVLQLLGPLSGDADMATVARHQAVRDGALRQWAEVRRG